MTKEEHYKFDHMTHKAKEEPKFDWVFEKHQELKEEYYQNNTIILKT